MIYDRDISDTFKRRVPHLELIDLAPGQSGYVLVQAEYVPDGATRFGPDHHVLVDVWGEDGTRQLGVPVNFTYTNGTAVVVVTNKVGVPYAADHALFNHGYEVGCWVGTERAASDYADGMGLGRIGSEEMNEHVTYYLVFQRVTADSAPTPEPLPVPPTTEPPAMALEHIDEAMRHLGLAKGLLLA